MTSTTLIVIIALIVFVGGIVSAIRVIIRPKSPLNKNSKMDMDGN